ncbi:hypothetical protein FRB95_013203 [Tulasnella sp. JGI-2019a]|nr:hypothetical protein FRB95_013203 [Tulasnella sp. JGI-2019a]
MVGTRKTTLASCDGLRDSDSDPYEHTYPAGLKRRGRKHNKKSYNKRVALVDITFTNLKPPPWTALPLDVVHEIFRWLEPLDLLQLARTTKTLRGHLMSKVSSSLWKATRVNVIGSPPECPEYMSEPAFARLLFMDECFVCGKIETNSRECPIYWEIQMRCCDKCLDGSRKFRKMKNASLVTELLPYASARHLFAPRRYYIPAIYKMVAAIKNYENLVLAPGTGEPFEKFKTTQKNHLAAMRVDARVYDYWHVTQKELVHAKAEKEAADKRLKAARKAVFTVKLLAEGHDHLGDIHSAFGAFDKAECLTDDGWIAIQNHAVAAVVQCKKERTQLARKPLLHRRRSVAVTVLMGEANINEDIFNPSLDEVASLFEPIRLVVDREDDEEATAKDVHDALEGVEEWVREWRTEKRSRMLQIMVSAGATAIADPPKEQDFARLKGDVEREWAVSPGTPHVSSTATRLRR